MTKFRKNGGNLAKRLRALEVKQEGDDKSTERKKQYYYVPTFLNNAWASNGNFVLRTNQGVEGETTAPGGTAAGLTRIGNSINIRDCRVNFYAALPKTTDGQALIPASGTLCRVMIVDNLKDNTSLVAADVLQTPAYAMTSSLKNSIAAGKRYRVLMDKKFALTSEKPDYTFSWKMKLPKSGRVVHYPNNLAFNPSDFNLSLIYICTDISPLSPNQPVMKYHVKTSFEDK